MALIAGQQKEVLTQRLVRCTGEHPTWFKLPMMGWSYRSLRWQYIQQMIVTRVQELSREIWVRPVSWDLAWLTKIPSQVRLSVSYSDFVIQRIRKLNSQTRCPKQEIVIKSKGWRNSEVLMLSSISAENEKQRCKKADNYMNSDGGHKFSRRNSSKT